MQMWRGLVEDKHPTLGMTQRAFAESACGTAAWLLTINPARRASRLMDPALESDPAVAGMH